LKPLKDAFLSRSVRLLSNANTVVSIYASDRPGRFELYLFGAFLVAYPMAEKGVLVQLDLHYKPSYRIKTKLPADWLKKSSKVIKHLLFEELCPGQSQQPSKVLLTYIVQLWRTQQLPVDKLSSADKMSKMWFDAPLFSATLSAYSSLFSLLHAINNSHQILLGKATNFPSRQPVWVVDDCLWNQKILQALGIKWGSAKSWLAVYQKHKAREEWSKKIYNIVQRACSLESHIHLSEKHVAQYITTRNQDSLNEKEMLLVAWELLDKKLIASQQLMRAEEVAIHFGEQLARLRRRSST